MAIILFYTAVRSRVRDQESLMVEFVKQGHSVFFVNTQDNPYLSSICGQAGVTYKTIKSPHSRFTIINVLVQCFQLIRFIHVQKISVVYSHLEPANFIAVLSQYFVRARVIIVRHHHDLAKLAGFHKDVSYRLTYKLARSVIAVSETTRKYMVKEEGILEDKIHVIPLGYNFSIFGSAKEEMRETLRRKWVGVIVITTVGRLDNYKRPELSLEVVKMLKDKGIKSHLFYLGSGEKQVELEQLIELYGLQNDVEILGYTDHVLEYLAASDWLLHPSTSESSCVVVKEAGLVKLPVIVCKGVGDFDEYLIDKLNSRLVDVNFFAEESSDILMTLKDKPEIRNQLGENLSASVRNRFNISAVIHRYDLFNA